MRMLIALLCLAGLALIACDNAAENRTAPANNTAAQSAKNGAANRGPTTASRNADDEDALDETLDYAADDDDADNDAGPPDQRPATWAQPIEAAGLPNFHRITDNLYRGAQPTAEGFRQLEKMGIKTVVNLRSAHSDRKLIQGTNLAYISIDMKAWHAEDEDIARFLKIVTNPDRQPIFVHCKHGADRTGTMSAVYRIVVQGWDKEDAIREMRYGGFGFHEIWTGLPKYIRKLDVEAIRKKAGLAE